MEKDDARKLSPAEQHERQRQVIRAHRRGRTRTQIAQEVGLSYTVVSKPVSVPSLQSLPVLFPFNLTRPLAYVVSRSAHLSVRSDGTTSQLVTLTETKFEQRQVGWRNLHTL